MNSVSTQRLLIALLSLIIFTRLSWAEQATDDFLPRLVNQQSVAGRFEQLRHISVLTVPLKSSGTFSYEKDNGITWQTLTPIASMLKIDPRHGVLSGQSPDRLEVVTSSQLVADIFLGLLSGDLNRLDALFSIAQNPVSDGWQLLLTPRAPGLAEYITTITVSGHNYVELIQLQEGNGDYSVITLTVEAAD